MIKEEEKGRGEGGEGWEMGGKEDNGEEREGGERESPNHHFQMMPDRQLRGLCFLFSSDVIGVKNFLICCQMRKKNQII